ncbi:hypothetical protein LUZ60_014908 [Juncus effusus]|nr:hypothetical protein LUZ60_014908 [Juncus effusus]
MAEIAGGGAPPPSLRRIQSTRRLLRHSLKSFLAFPSLPALLLSAFLLLAFRSVIYFAALRLLTLAVSDDPSLQDLLLPGSVSFPPPPPPPLGHFTHIPSLEPDRVFSSSRRSSPPSNYSFYHHVSSYNYVKIPVPELFSSPFFFTSPPAVKSEEDQSKDSKRPSRKEVALFIGLGFLIVFAYILLVFASVFLQSSALGVVFYSVVSTAHFKRPLVPLQLFLSGSSIGIDRLTPLMFLHWSLKDSALQLLTSAFLISMEVPDDVQLFKIFFNSKLIMPFSPVSLASPLSRSALASLSSFFLAYTLIDSFISVVFTIPPWVELMEAHDKRRDKCEFKEGIFLLSLMPNQALCIKCIEAVLSGSFARSLMVKIGGRFCGGFVCAIVEVYVMVVWLNFYLSVRCKEAELEGKRFELKDLEDYLDYVKVKS